MRRFCLWIMMVMNHDRMVFVNGLCATRAADWTMLCDPCTDQELPTTDTTVVYKALFLKECHNMTLRKERLLNEYPNILEFFTSHIPNISTQIKNHLPLDTFSGFTQLKRFHFTNSNLTNNETWILPPTVQIYQVDYNNYTFLDLSTLTNLEEFSADNNNFTNLPKFSQPYSEIKVISLNENPISQLSLPNIVPLCFLETLQLKMQADLFNTSEDDFCRCLALTTWIKNFNINGSNIKCPPMTHEVHCKSNFSYYEQIRRECRNEDIHSPTPEASQVEFARKLLFIFMGIMVCGLLFTVCGITIVHYFFHPHRDHDKSVAKKRQESVEQTERDDGDRITEEPVGHDEHEEDED